MSTLSRKKWEYEIPVTDANEMARQPGAYSLEKTRYFIQHMATCSKSIATAAGLEGLYSVEVEMDSKKALITLPNWVGEEVTDNKAGAARPWPETAGRPDCLLFRHRAAGQWECELYAHSPQLSPVSFTVFVEELTTHCPDS